MNKTVSKKALYRHLKSVTDDVMENGHSYTVIQNSRPAFYIVPLSWKVKGKYSKKDLDKFIFKGKDKSEDSLAVNFKRYLYGEGSG